MIVGAVALGLAAAAWFGARRAERIAGESLVAIERSTSLPLRTRPRPWRWATEAEWVVYETARNIVSWARIDSADDPANMSLEVHRRNGSADPGVFEVSLKEGNESRVFQVQPALHIWDPDAYVPLARALLGEGATTHGPPAARLGDLLLTSDTSSMREADFHLFGELKARPRDSLLHEQAALLWTAYALRNSMGARRDERPFLNGLVAHISLARALRDGKPSALEGRISEIALDVLLYRQTSAVEALDRLEAEPKELHKDAWARALRTRVTHDPRPARARRPATRLEMLEALIAARRSRRDCETSYDLSRRWGLPRAADWALESVSCLDQKYEEAFGDPVAFQARDTAEVMELSAPEATVVDIARALRSASDASTHQPSRPSSMIPEGVRADAGLARLTMALEEKIGFLKSRGLPDEIRETVAGARDLLTSLPAGPFVEHEAEAVLLKRGEKGTGNLCAPGSKLIARRPDLLTDSDWKLMRDCVLEVPLKMLRVEAWDPVVVPGTARMGPGPWRTGPGVKAPAFVAAGDLAPWHSDIPWTARMYWGHERRLTAQEVLHIAGRTVDYDVNMMVWVVEVVRDDVPLAIRASMQACELDIDTCAPAANKLAQLDQDEVALRLFRKAFRGAFGGAVHAIDLSNHVGWYVNLLLDRDEVREALHVANWAGQVYSGAGLQTLGMAYERLGRFRDAAETYRAITERYGQPCCEDDFYVRHARREGDSPFEARTQEAMKALFPGGIKGVTPEQMKATRLREGIRTMQRTDGMSLNLFANADERLKDLGLTYSDTVLTVNGLRVDTWAQFATVVSFTDEQSVTLIVRRGDGSIEEVSGHYRHWKYGRFGARAARK